ncbi:MAG: membrane protein insertase YidC [Gammaproteobacteria bacterium]|nr:membrane protein insertase YidC [Gammaproteobacteria bacterium]MBT8057292.1 membrane protein insertase YidC [Gammaproteobacteria bacterium]NNJ78656.1 membrane protein insertase YidC [Xanthomonadales bacterium]
MGNLRPVLIMGLVFLGYLMWIEWQKDYGPAPQPRAAENTTLDVPGDVQPDVPVMDTSAPSATADLPVPAAPAKPEASATAPQMTEGERVRVTTDVLDVRISTVGGTIVSAVLRNYPVDLDKPDTLVELLQSSPERLFIAQSGLLSNQEAPNHTSRYQPDAMEYDLSEGEAELRVPLRWTSADGLVVTKTFVFRPGHYDIAVEHSLENRGAQAWAGSRYEQLQQSVPVDEDKAGFTNPGRYSFYGIGFYDPESKFEKIAFDDVVDDPYRVTSERGWLAMIQHYFFAAWIPESAEEATYTTQAIRSGGAPRYIARAVSPAYSLPPGASHNFNSVLYVGPKLQEKLPDIAEGLELTVNYGIFTVFSKPLFWLLEKIHEVVGNWGWAIVLLTVLIKAAFFKLTEAQYRSTARMRKLQPRIEQLKERYGDDRQRMSQAMMEMYKKEKVNPLGGCLPILVQIPIFIALYWVLLESVELRQAPFILWIDNLSVRDPYFILPALNAVFMFATQRLTPMVGMDPLQQKMMQAMPIVFSIMFAFFPAGLVLYWATNAGLSLAQQYYITRKIAASD